MLLPPSSTRRFDATPIEGFEAIPLVGSEPPHSSANVISLIPNSTLTSFDTSRAILLTISAPLETVFNVPPHSCITT